MTALLSRRTFGQIGSVAATGARLAVGILFLIAGISKLRMPYVFLDTVYQYSLVGPKLGLAIAVILPAVEVIVGVCILISAWMVPAALTTTLLTLVFAISQALVAGRGSSAQCGCFGSSELIGSSSFARTLLIALASAYLLVYFRLKRDSLLPWSN